jgi:hypothetical protein
MKKYEEYIKKNKLDEVYNNKSFKDITTIKIGGKIMMLTSQTALKVETPNLDQILAQYGVKLEFGAVYEQDGNR